MIVLSVNVDSEQRSLLVIVLEKDNLERMRKADPVTLESAKRGGVLTGQLKYPNDVSMLLAYEEDDAMLYKLARAGDIAELVTYLERGRKWKPGVDGVENVVRLKDKAV